MTPRAFFLVCAAFLATVSVRAQAPDQNPLVPTITFDRIWEPFTPQEVTITVQAGGTATYRSRNPLKAPEAGADPDYSLNFTMSAPDRDKVFRYATEANYFNGDFSFKKHPVASTGQKTLTYADTARHFQTTYDYSENKAIQEITNIFQGISNTIEYGRKLQFLHRFDRLGLEAELKGMESAMESHNLGQLQLIAPTLKRIADDPAILNIARQRAKRLLAKTPSE
jgi:hypothetical protein